MARASSSHCTKKASQQDRFPRIGYNYSYLGPIPKPCKDYRKLNGYRILTTQNTTGMLTERIMARKLAHDLERRNVLPTNQGGYRSGKATWENAARSHTMFTKDSRGRNKLDLEDVYDKNAIQTAGGIHFTIIYGVSLALTRCLAVHLQETKVATQLAN